MKNEELGMKNEELGMKNWYAVVGKFIIRNS